MFSVINSFTVLRGSFSRKNFWCIYRNTDLHGYQKKMRIVFRHCFWSTLRINRSRALSDSLNSCAVGTIFCLPILLRKRVTAACIRLCVIDVHTELYWTIPRIWLPLGYPCYLFRFPNARLRRCSQINELKLSRDRTPNKRAIRTAYAPCIIPQFRSWMAQKWHRLCIFNSSIPKQEALRFVYIQTARDETTNANALH